MANVTQQADPNTHGHGSHNQSLVVTDPGPAPPELQPSSLAPAQTVPEAVQRHSQTVGFVHTQLSSRVRTQERRHRDERKVVTDVISSLRNELAAARDGSRNMARFIRNTRFSFSMQHCNDCSDPITHDDFYVYNYCGAVSCILGLLSVSTYLLQLGSSDAATAFVSSARQPALSM